jgi:hypothetical protein
MRADQERFPAPIIGHCDYCGEHTVARRLLDFWSCRLSHPGLWTVGAAR